MKELTTKAVPGARTPKAVASLLLLHLFLKDHYSLRNVTNKFVTTWEFIRYVT